MKWIYKYYIIYIIIYKGLFQTLGPYMLQKNTYNIFLDFLGTLQVKKYEYDIQ